MKKMIVSLLIAILALNTAIFAGEVGSKSIDGQKPVTPTTQVEIAKEFVPTLSYQAILKDAKGNLLKDGEYKVSFKLYDAVDAKSPLYTEEQTVKVADGVVNAQIGSVKALELPFDKQYWLSLSIDQEEMERAPLSASAYSLQKNVKSVNGQTGELKIVGRDGVSVNSANGEIVISGGANQALRGGVGGTGTAGPTVVTADIVNGGNVNATYVKTNGMILPSFESANSMYYTSYYGNNGVPDFNTNYGGGMCWIAGDNSYYGPKNSYGLYSKNAMSFRAWGTNPIMFLTDGRIEIPNGSPIPIGAASAKLYVGGNIWATDASFKKVTATEITVQANQGWADYVFADDYNRMSLDEVEAFVKENRHLPGVPSAKEIESKGINVSDMQKIFMEKIEELTLHMIDMKKESDNMKKENDELKKRVNALTK